MTIATTLAKASYETLKLDVSDSILTVTISRPEALNALSNKVITDLRSVVDGLSEQLGNPGTDGFPDWSIRGIILTGDGEKSFIAGGDISEMGKMGVEDIRTYAGAAQQFTAMLETLPVPVVAAVNGFALGGGCELALSCDVIFAAETASFGQPEVALGLIPGFGGTVRLQKAVGPQLARDLIFTGRRISAAEAHNIGLATRVYPSITELHTGAREFLSQVAAQSPVAVAAAKHAVRSVAHLSTDDGLDVELDAFAKCFGTEDMREGTTAFVEKRKPNFPGK